MREFLSLGEVGCKVPTQFSHALRVTLPSNVNKSNKSTLTDFSPFLIHKQPEGRRHLYLGSHQAKVTEDARKVKDSCHLCFRS